MKVIVCFGAVIKENRVLYFLTKPGAANAYTAFLEHAHLVKDPNRGLITRWVKKSRCP
jgi:hypothetical protein